MKLDLVLCLATAAYAAPIPPRVKKAVDGVVENAVAGVKDAAPQLLQRLGNEGARGNVAQGLKEEVTGGPQVSAQLSAQLLVFKGAKGGKHLTALTKNEKEYLKLSEGIKTVKDQIALLRKVKSGAYERSDGQSALAIVSRYIELYPESFPKAKDVDVEDVIGFAQKRANELKSKLPKVKELSDYSALKRKTDELLYVPRRVLAFPSFRAVLKAMEKAKQEVKNAEYRVRVATDYGWEEANEKKWALEYSREELRLIAQSYAYWKMLLGKESVKAAKNILSSVDVAQKAVTTYEKQLKKWNRELIELNGMTTLDRNKWWDMLHSYPSMFYEEKKIDFNESTLDQVKNFARDKIRKVEELLTREREILEKARSSELALNKEETEKLKNLANSVAEQEKQLVGVSNQ
jgi:hypothetical protein